jgi:lipopolysaccharide transport system ATP-binding protein
MTSAIQVRDLSKEYVIGGRDRAATTFREALAGAFASPFKRVLRRGRAAPEERFWALRQLTFDVAPGEIVGIVGSNGAGKSTLLKILSRITEPTNGSAELRGRVASLLEVGTGFHPELTGRENVFLNGAILGMSRREIQRKFDDIVAFAEVEQFLDTPVKHYSSGMYVRLAFAVAAHLEPEILLVDEVLAVGDVRFQRKCVEKIGDVARLGRTILFVSHNLVAIQQVCQRGLLLDAGRISVDGPINQVIERYLRSSVEEVRDSADKPIADAAAARFRRWRIRNGEPDALHSCHSRDACQFEFELTTTRAITQAYVGFAVWGTAGELIAAASSVDSTGYHAMEPGMHRVTFEMRLPVRPGLYQLDVSLNSTDHGLIERWHAVPHLNVLPPVGERTSLPPEWHGVLNESCRFTHERVS